MEDVRIPVDRPPPAAATHAGDAVIRDVLRRYRDVEAGATDPPKLLPAMVEARREQIFDNAVELDRALVEVVVAAMWSLRRIRESYPELVRPA